jgi:radical SAM superfamily enzyme YgiQ (UPF0313 family)
MKVKGIAIRSKDGKVKITEKREPIWEFDSLPFPTYDHVKRPIKIYPIFSSRGCPFKCIFCCRIMGEKLRVRSPENVVDEIEYAVWKYNPKLIDFADDQFTFPKDRAMKICDLIIKRGLKIKWTCLSRVTGVDRELFYEMKKRDALK